MFKIIVLLLFVVAVVELNCTSLIRQKRYDLHGVVWDSNDITYKITQYSGIIPNKVVDKELRRAFNTWGEVSDLMFIRVEKNEKALIQLK